jgi:hypothetical protein
MFELLSPPVTSCCYCFFSSFVFLSLHSPQKAYSLLFFFSQSVNEAKHSFVLKSDYL